jgi:AcrR family transcriptional regulator
VANDQRERLLAAVPGVVAARGYEAMSVADIVKAAAVSRNAFYKSFSDKQDCFATAHDACHERLLDILTGQCEDGDTTEQRVERSLAAGLEALASEPDLARMLFVEAPSAGRRSLCATTNGCSATEPCCAPSPPICPYSLSLRLRLRV